MAQHDNGRRPAGTASGVWQQGHRDPQDFSSSQQEQSTSGRYGAPLGGGQQGGHDESGLRGHHDQYDYGRQQQGDNWRERQGPAAGGWRPAMEERDRSWNDRGSAYGSQGGYGGQGSFGGQASDNDYGNRGITESGNFGNYGGARENAYSTMSGRQGRHGQGSGHGATSGQGGSYDQGGQSAQRFGGYGHGYDARSDSTGGYGSSDFGPENRFGSGNYGGGSGSDRYLGGGRGYDRTYGQSSADIDQGSRGWQGQSGPSNRDRYGDNGYQGNWQLGQHGGQAYHDPDYQQWRMEQLAKLDRDYDEWRRHRYERFSEDFDNWRSNRDNRQGGAQSGGSMGSAGATSSSGLSEISAAAGGQGERQSAASGEHAGPQASKPDAQNADKGKPADASSTKK